MLDRYNREEAHRHQCTAVVPYASLDEVPDGVKDQMARMKQGKHTVLVLYYGGTIGMVPGPEGHLIPADDADALLKPLYVKGLDKEVNVVWFPVWDHAIDSTNGQWPHWVSIANAIKLLYGYFDGFVVCGGTDTMTHLLAALHFIFPNIGKPIIGTGAQLPMYRLGDDATGNMYFSIEAACMDLSGPHLAFNQALRNGLRVFKHADRRFDAFTSTPPHHIGEFAGEVTLFPNAPRRNPIVTKDRLEFNPAFRQGIKVIKISPATSAASILHDALDPTNQVLLLITYGAGNVRDEGVYVGETTHIEAMRMLHEHGYPVVLGTPMMDGVVDSPYASGAKAVSEEVGGISAGDTSGASLEVKLMRCLALATSDSGKLNYSTFRKEVFRNHVGELITK